MRKIIWFAVLDLILFAVAARCQSVSPMVSEYKKSARGSFTVSNNTLRPMTVVVEPVSFHLVKGQQVTEPLSNDVHLELSDMTVRLAPKQSRVITYRAKCDALPCGFAIYSRFMDAQHTTEGVAVALHLPSSVYICPDKTKGCRERVRAILEK